MELNVGSADRLVRIILGVTLLAIAYFQPLGPWPSDVLTYLVVAAGIVVLATGVFGMCLLYRLFGTSTRRS